jgi:hypothetical protein
MRTVQCFLCHGIFPCRAGAAAAKRYFELALRDNPLHLKALVQRLLG